MKFADIRRAVLSEATEDSKWLASLLSNSDIDPYHWSWAIPMWAEESGRSGFDDSDPPGYEELKPKDQKAFAKWLEDNVDRLAEQDPVGDQPNRNMSFIRHMKSTAWLVHFSDDAEEIASSGFAYGADLYGLHLTRHFTDAARKRGGEWAFAYDAGSRNADSRGHSGDFGREAVLFQSNAAIEVNHYGDEERQVIFNRTSAVNRIALFKDDGMWVVRDIKTGADLHSANKISEMAKWLTSNFAQHRRRLVSK